MISPVASDEPQEKVPLDTSLIVAFWRYLASMDRHSPFFLFLLDLLTARDNQLLTTEFRGADARDTLGIMDEVLRAKKVAQELEINLLHTMRTLAYVSGQVPPRYQVNRHSLSWEADVIASGTFADVRRGRLDDKAVAIRTLWIGQNANGDRHKKLFCKECIIWMNISHPNLLQLLAIDINSQTGQYSMISELMANGNITEYIRQKSANRHRLLKDVAAGLCYLHEHDIVHGDLKGSNILITNETPPGACLADFGLSTLAPSPSGVTATDTAGGTFLYMAPELIAPSIFGSSTARPTKPADMYALGMVILEVLTGAQPFSEKGWVISEVTYRVVSGERPTKPDDAVRIGLGGGTWELVEECWMQQPTKRPRIEQALERLTRVAASSIVVDPTPEVSLSRDAPRLDSFSKIYPFDDTKTTANSTISSNQSGVMVSPSNSTPASGMSGGDCQRALTRVMPKSKSLPTGSAFPRQPSVLASSLFVEPTRVHDSTIPMPILFVRKAQKPDHFGLVGLFDKLKPKKHPPMKHLMDLLGST